MGVVYEAVQEPLGRRVAVKVLTGPATASAVAVERFRREARTAAGLHHTNIVPVFAVGDEAGTPYYAMQFIDGRPLDRSVDAPIGPDSYRAVARLGLQIAEALAYAHAQGILHRDVKPSNRCWTAGERCGSDFGSQAPTARPDGDR